MSGRSRLDEKKKPKRDSSKSRTRKSPSRTDTRVKSPARVQKSPKKPRVKSPNKSPARKSPSRKTPVSRSPSRKSPIHQSPSRKSPGRRSPARSRRDSVDTKFFVKSSSTPVFDVDSDSDSPEAYFPKVRKPQATVQGRTRRLDMESKPLKDVDNEQKNNRNFYSGITRRSIHVSKQPHESEKIVHLKETFTAYEQKLTELSDEDDLIHQNKVIDSIEPRSSRRDFVTEFGGWFGAMFFIAYMPFYFIGINIICNEKSCSFSLPDLALYKKPSTYLNASAILSFLAYSVLLALLTGLPFGGPKIPGFFNKNGKLVYVMNGFFQAVVVHLIMIGLELLNVPVVNFIYNKYLQLTVSSVILGILFSIYLYVRSFFVPISTLNPNGDTNSTVYNFFMGRETGPRIFNVVDARMFLVRMIHISLSLLNSVLLCKSLGLNSKEFKETWDLKLLNIHISLFVILILLYVYFLDALVFEHTWITTFELQHEGVGYMSSVAFFAAAFSYALIPKYVMEYRVELNTWLLIACVVQFLIGYTLYRGSNNQKYEFRRNPYSPAVAHLETIPTSQGKKLIVSGFWGFVRHPNYLGDLLLHFSFLYFVISVPPAIVCLLPLPVLIHRTVRDGWRCKQKYEAAWDRYCKRVKYVLIPKIY